MSTAGTWYAPSAGTGGFLAQLDGQVFSNPPFHHAMEHQDLASDQLQGAPAAPALPSNYIDPEHTGEDRALLEAFYGACLSEGGTADEMTLRGLRAAIALDRARRAAPAPTGKVGELVEWLRDHAMDCKELGRPDWAEKCRTSSDLLEHQPAPTPVAWCRADEFENAMKKGGSFNGWKDPGAGPNRCDMRLYALPVPSEGPTETNGCKSSLLKFGSNEMPLG